jgi:hypothetical protein
MTHFPDGFVWGAATFGIGHGVRTPPVRELLVRHG